MYMAHYQESDAPEPYESDVIVEWLSIEFVDDKMQIHGVKLCTALLGVLRVNETLQVPCGPVTEPSWSA